MFEKNTNFEYKIFSKQEGLIKKITNHFQKIKRNQNQTWKKKTKTMFFKDFSFSRSNENNLLKALYMPPKTQRLKEEHKETLHVTNSTTNENLNKKGFNLY